MVTKTSLLVFNLLIRSYGFFLIARRIKVCDVLGDSLRSILFLLSWIGKCTKSLVSFHISVLISREEGTVKTRLPVWVIPNSSGLYQNGGCR